MAGSKPQLLKIEFIGKSSRNSGIIAALTNSSGNSTDFIAFRLLLPEKPPDMARIALVEGKLEMNR